MYDELVKRLREAPNDWPDADLHYEAADAIDELSRLLDGVSTDSDSLCTKIRELDEEKNRMDNSKSVVPVKWVLFENPNYSPFDESEECVYQCDKCKSFQHHRSNFCPNCGADMREGKQDE